MAKGFKTGGRSKGSVNKSTRDVTVRLAELSCDPIEGMARIALNEQNSPELRGRMFAELAQYVAPKRKAVELSGELGVVSLAEVIRERRFKRPVYAISTEEGLQ